MKKNLQKGL